MKNYFENTWITFFVNFAMLCVALSSLISIFYLIGKSYPNIDDNSWHIGYQDCVSYYNLSKQEQMDFTLWRLYEAENYSTSKVFIRKLLIHSNYRDFNISKNDFIIDTNKMDNYELKHCKDLFGYENNLCW